MEFPPVSLWMDQMDSHKVTRPPPDKDLHVDVAIVGAGYTGLWTAYYLKQNAPHLRVAVFEAREVGYGASGRNGGWLLGRILGEEKFLSSMAPGERLAWLDLLKGIPDRVADVLKKENIHCGYRKGGVLTCAARYPEQKEWLRDELKHLYAQGYTETDFRYLNAAQLADHVRMNGAYGAIFSPHCATIHPAQLVCGLAETIERLGVRIYENSRVGDWKSNELQIGECKVSAPWVVSCVEGHGAEFQPMGQYQLAVQSIQIATEPLSASKWSEIGLSDGQAAHESSKQVTYFHRSRDDRLVFGARGSYRFGGHLREDFTLSRAEVKSRQSLMLQLFPQLSGVSISHGWGGNLGMTRRFLPYMLCDRNHGVASAGGFGGEGVGASHLAGQTLADLIADRDTRYTRAPWVIRQGTPAKALRRWEPEPIRWLGYWAVSTAYRMEDNVLAQPESARWRRHMASAIATGASYLLTPDVKVG